MEKQKPKATVFNLGSETHEVILALIVHMEAQSGLRVSRSNVVRRAIFELAKSEGLRD